MEIKFAYNQKENTFSRNIDYEVRQQGAVTLEDIDNTLGELEVMVKERYRLIIFSGFCFYLFLFAVIIGGPFLGGFADINGKQALLLVGFLVSLIFGGIYRCYNYISGLELGLKDEARSIVNKYNEMLKNKGLRWNVSRQFPAFIELIVDERVIRRQRNQNHHQVVAIENQETSLSQPLLDNAS